MAAEGHQVALLSGELTVEQRAAIIQRFREGKEKVLITTNVCSRGEYYNTYCARALWEFTNTSNTLNEFHQSIE